MTAVLSLEAAAEYLGHIQPATLKRLAAHKKIGHIKEGRTVTFPVTCLDTYIEAHTVPVQENAWGLTDASLASIRDGRTKRVAS